ncbi:Isochorismatase hydrolase [Eremomyces bilateralis CBS 781.70]|uniref:nicotinamidase n=1 Tax=Eremomyces bilateralis CBS 781.70 TaxID=1392243 RepID=A0A6G1GDQ4_9PEZI|nr:Isochorismatase hydrolase [Eremomyces bilateralis CBS 781.70]KAF1816173.1 Isochorismatase hydrolase [Eremomyces bilateralis CBS 781.70]
MFRPAITMGSQPPKFNPALLIVDFQEDFCPPNGSLAVKGGRDIAPVLNRLLDLPFTLKIATKDWHPKNHVSFASNHPHPNNKPFESFFTITNPLNPAESAATRLWPDHCVQRTPGAELAPELDQTKLDEIIEKGQDERVEMYSVFADLFVNPTVYRSGISKMLKEKEITHVYVAGLAMDYCVKYSALHAAKEGFGTVVIADATKAVDPHLWDQVKAEMEQAGVIEVGGRGSVPRGWL